MGHEALGFLFLLPGIQKKTHSVDTIRRENGNEGREQESLAGASLSSAGRNVWVPDAGGGFPIV